MTLDVLAAFLILAGGLLLSATVLALLPPDWFTALDRLIGGPRGEEET